jgi:hypothetical protein
MCFHVCNVAHAQEAARLDGIPDSIPEGILRGACKNRMTVSSQMIIFGYAPLVILARSDVHVEYQLQIPFLISEDLQLERV